MGRDAVKVVGNNQDGPDDGSRVLVERPEEMVTGNGDLFGINLYIIYYCTAHAYLIFHSGRQFR